VSWFVRQIREGHAFGNEIEIALDVEWRYDDPGFGGTSFQACTGLANSASR